MKKYIIKNCPAFSVLTKQCKGAYSKNIGYQYCSGNDNCLLKQIVKTVDTFRSCYADTVLNILEIEEVEGCEDYTENHKELTPYAKIKETKHYCYSCNDTCIDKDCYFKQLQRAKAENELLRQTLKNKNIVATVEENEKLKKTLQEIKEIINTCLEFKTCEKCKFYKACNRDLEGCILTLIKKAEEE